MAKRKTIIYLGIIGTEPADLSLCHEHGPVAGKIRIRKTDEGKYFGVKTLKVNDTEAADEIREKHESLRRKKLLRRGLEKQV